jgi:hypothetical protein
MKHAPKKGREDYQALALTAINDRQKRWNNASKQRYFYIGINILYCSPLFG